MYGSPTPHMGGRISHPTPERFCSDRLGRAGLSAEPGPPADDSDSVGRWRRGYDGGARLVDEGDRSAKVKTSKKLYGHMRDGGVRKKVTKDLAALPAIGSGGSGHPSRSAKPSDDLRASFRSCKSMLAGESGRLPRERAPARGRQRQRNAAALRSGGRKPARRPRWILDLPGEPAAHERAVVRWLGRSCLERPSATLADVLDALAAADPNSSQNARIRLSITGVTLDAPGRIRTCDFCLRRAALYPLSYGRRLGASLVRTC